MLRTCHKKRRPDKAIEVFVEVQPHEASMQVFHVMLEVLGSRPDDGIQVLHKLLRFGYTPTEVTYNRLLGMFCTPDRFDEIPGVIEWSRKFMAEASFNMAIDVRYIAPLVDKGDIAGVMKWIDRMVGVGLRVDVGVYNSIFRVCANNATDDDPEPAREWLVKSIDQGIKLPAKIFNHAIASFTRKLDVERGESCFAIIESGDLQPNEITLTLLATTNIIKGDDDRALYWMTKVDDYKLSKKKLSKKKVYCYVLGQLARYHNSQTMLMVWVERMKKEGLPLDEAYLAIIVELMKQGAMATKDVQYWSQRMKTEGIKPTRQLKDLMTVYGIF